MDVLGNKKKKPIWVSDGGENIGNCIFNDSFTFDRNISVSFFGIATAKLFNDLVLLASTLGIVLTARLGRRGMQDATIFFLTENDGLWIMDARSIPNYGDGFLGFAVGAMETQAFLRLQGKKPYLPQGADEILKVWGIKENNSHYVIRCQSRHPNKRVTRHTYFLVKGLQDEEMLLKEFERRKTWENTLEPAENRNMWYILLSGVGLAVCVIMCVMSHPAVARMPGTIYFPCMGASLIAFCFLFYFIIRQRRGE